MTILGSRFWPSLLILVSILVFLSSWYPCAILLTSSPISSVMVLGILPTASHRSKPYFRSVSINTSHPMPELWGDVLQRLHFCGQGGGIVYLRFGVAFQVCRAGQYRMAAGALTNGRTFLSGLLDS